LAPIPPTPHDEDTIVAIATPTGRGAIAIVRMSGAAAFEIARHHVIPWPGKPRVATLCLITDRNGELDQGLATLFPSPDSFTGENVFEVSTHGGHAVPLSVTAAFIRSGARQAVPGEFTRRAILNGKLDLIQAEGIGELVDSRSSAMQRAALVQLHGGLTRKLTELRDSFISLEALIAYEIDFPEEDDGPIDERQIQSAAARVEKELEEILSTASFGELIREGAIVVIAGPPNSGKSSLFNALLGKARAIVTEVPGTTRDALEAVIEAEGWPLRLVDTAGLRDTDNRIERLGIEVSERYLSSADIVLACAESDEGLDHTLAVISALTPAPVLRVMTKADLHGCTAERGGLNGAGLMVSAERRTGLEALLDRISEVLRSSYGKHPADAPVLTTARQSAALSKALEELRSFNAARTREGIPATIAAVHLRTAAGVLEELIGSVDVEDVLAKLFSTFCVGK
jgi:tRNA modification GTPase